MTLQQREPYENLARMVNPVRQKVNPISEKSDKEYAEKAETIHEIVRRSFQNNSKFKGTIHEQQSLTKLSLRL